MLKDHSSFVKQMIAGIDCLLILTAFFMSYYLTGQEAVPGSFTEYWIMPAGFGFFYLYFAWTRSLFSIMHFSWMRGLAISVVKVFLYTSSLCAALLYVLHLSVISPRLYITFALLSFVLISMEKIVVKIVTARFRSGSYRISPIIVFGRGREAARLCHEIESNPEWGLRIIYKMDITTPLEEFQSVILNSFVEEIFFCIPRHIAAEKEFSIDPYIKVCEDVGRSARVFINLPSVTKFASWDYHQFMDRPTLMSHTVDLDPDQLTFKRMFDIAGALVGMCFLILFYPILAALIKATSRGPVFFKQIRVGKNGKRFIIYKFRSMYVNAEARKKELEDRNQCSGAIFKMKDDPRVTPVGRIMRRFSLDELPQFIDVLRGEMSLVGTRPPTPEEIEKYKNWHHRRTSIMPGITGLWQVSGRNKITDFDEIAKLDLKYIERWSIWLDVKIILKTFFVVFQRDSAY
jgi:exopolysaccharide biosynthesis polyprenyl glycosylphosphotransferase